MYTHSHTHTYTCTGRYVRRRLKGYQVHESAWTCMKSMSSANSSVQGFFTPGLKHSRGARFSNPRVRSWLQRSIRSVWEFSKESLQPIECYCPTHPTPKRQDVSHVASSKNESAQKSTPPNSGQKCAYVHFVPQNRGKLSMLLLVCRRRTPGLRVLYIMVCVCIYIHTRRLVGKLPSLAWNFIPLQGEGDRGSWRNRSIRRLQATWHGNS